MSFYLSPEEATQVLLTRLNDKFDINGSFDYEKAAKAIYGSVNKRSLKDIRFVLAFPDCSQHLFLIWEYVDLKMVKVFKNSGGIPNRDGGQSDREGTEDSGEEVSGSDRICSSPQSYVI